MTEKKFMTIIIVLTRSEQSNRIRKLKQHIPVRFGDAVATLMKPVEHRLHSLCRVIGHMTQSTKGGNVKLRYRALPRHILRKSERHER